MTDDWGLCTLGDVAEIRGGGTPSTQERSYWGGDIVWLTPTEVVKAVGCRIRSSERTITDSGLANSSAKLLPAGTVLLTTRASVGFAAIAAVPVTTNQGFQSLIPGDTVLPEYLMYWIQSNRDEFTSRAGGSTFPEISKTKVAKIPILVPPLSVQRRIVDLMAHLDNHLANLKAEREAADRLVSTLRAQLAETSRWVVLKDLAESDGIQIGPFGSQLHASEYSDEGVPVVMPRDLMSGRISTSQIKRVPPQVADRLKRHWLQPGDIVFPRRGDLGKRALVMVENISWVCGTGCLRFRPAEGVDGRQVFESLSGQWATDWLIEHAVGSTMLNLNTTILSDLPVPDPLHGDAAIAESCVRASELVDALGSEVSRLSGLRTSLLDHLLREQVQMHESYDSFLNEVA